MNKPQGTLQYFVEGSTERGYGDPGIILDDIFSMQKENGLIVFKEECDGFYSKEMTPEDAVKMLNEAIRWIEDPTTNAQKNPS